MALERIQTFTKFSRAKNWQKILQSHQTDQNFIDWHKRQSHIHLPLLKGKEKFSLELLGKTGSPSNDLSSRLLGFCGILHFFLS